MLKKIIIIENENDYQCDTLEELVKKIIDKNFYNISEEERKNKMKMLAIANTMNPNIQIIENKCEIDLSQIQNQFIITNEFTYILSLLLTNNVYLLERRNSSIFNKYIKEDHLQGNYININHFAKEILKKYLE